MRIALDIPPGLNADDTASRAAPAWVDSNLVRFRLGQPETVGGWESLVIDNLGGVCRAVFPWTDNDNILDVAFGTHQTLEVFQGGALYDITPSSGFTAGQIDGTGSTGFGTGGYGVGGYGSPSATDYFPLTWDFAALGENLIANPRNQGIFRWQNNTAAPAAILTNAPTQVAAMIVARDFIFALGCNEEVSGNFNPLCIRHSDVRGPTAWSTIATSASTSREYILPGGGRIVSGREIGRSILVWTNHSLWLGTYVGSIQKIWQFDQVGKNCGLLGPKAVVIRGTTAYWTSPDRQFYAYPLGGSVQSIPCPIREAYADNLAASQGDKVMAATIAEYDEVWWFYPDSRDGYENSRYLAVPVGGPDAGFWHRGQLARTAFVDAGPSAYPLGVAYDGRPYWHERGTSADGAVRSWSIKTSDTALDDNVSMLIRGAWPDIADQTGPVNLAIYTRQYPQGAVTTFGPYALAPADDKVDFKASGRLIAVEFSGSSAPSEARLGRVTFEVKARGRR